jgi:hypothetical protein
MAKDNPQEPKEDSSEKELQSELATVDVVSKKNIIIFLVAVLVF